MKEGYEMTKKILALLLALVMVLGAVPFFAFAEGEEEIVEAAYDRVDAWDANLAPVVANLLDNEQSAHWKYVAENNDVLRKTMITYTAFALYDNAWKNGFDQSVSVEEAEKILVSLLEKVDANIGSSKVEEIIKVLQTAQTANELIQKVNSYIQIAEVNDVVTSAEWNKAFSYINTAIKIGNFYKDNRDKVIEAYARLLTVQASNAYYKQILTYVAEHTNYSVVEYACKNLIKNADDSVNEFLQEETKNRLKYTTDEVLTTAARIALESNSYTAIALKVYDIGKSAADVLWNTSDQYALMDELYTTFFVETEAVNWTNAVKEQGDKEAYEYGVSFVLGIREIGAQSLYNLKVAQNNGIVGKVKNQINLNVGFENVAELAFLANAREVLFADVETIKPVTAIITATTAATIDVNGYRTYNVAETFATDNGYYLTMYSPAIGNYVKSIFLNSDANVSLIAASDALATVVVKKLGADGIAQKSFTDKTVAADGIIAFNTADDSYTYTLGEETVETAFDTTFVYPELNAVTAKSVADASASVIKGEISNALEGVKGKVITIDQLVRNIIDQIVTAIKALFNIKIFG